jgi:hypothetical protein
MNRGNKRFTADGHLGMHNQAYVEFCGAFALLSQEPCHVKDSRLLIEDPTSIYVNLYIFLLAERSPIAGEPRYSPTAQ